MKERMKYFRLVYLTLSKYKRVLFFNCNKGLDQVIESDLDALKEIDQELTYELFAQREINHELKDLNHELKNQGKHFPS
jgi:hypothetical protein